MEIHDIPGVVVQRLVVVDDEVIAVLLDAVGRLEDVPRVSVNGQAHDAAVAVDLGPQFAVGDGEHLAALFCIIKDFC